MLVVEDDLPLAQLLHQQLRAKSHDVSVVHDGEAARQAIADGKFDLIILDLNLPKLDGISLLQRIRPVQPRLPVLVLTARHRVEDRALSLDAGADDCMVKPFSFVELHARVRALLRRNTGPISRVSRVADLLLDREDCGNCHFESVAGVLGASFSAGLETCHHYLVGLFIPQISAPASYPLRFGATRY